MPSHNGSVTGRVAAYRVAIHGRRVHCLVPQQGNRFYYARESPADTMMPSRFAATSVGTLCEELQKSLTRMRRVVCNSTVVYNDCSVCTLYNHAQKNVMTL